MLKGNIVVLGGSWNFGDGDGTSLITAVLGILTVPDVWRYYTGTNGSTGINGTLFLGVIGAFDNYVVIRVPTYS